MIDELVEEVEKEKVEEEVLDRDAVSDDDGDGK